MEYQNLICEQADGVLTITLNRPKQMNAINQALIDELSQVLREASTDSEVVCVVVAGSEKFFCAGADITEVNKTKTAFQGYAFSKKFQRCFAQIEQFNKPVIAAVRGFALGGGFELMLACDFRIAAEDAKLGVPEVNIGALPAGGGTVKLPRLIGSLKAMELLLMGDTINGKKAVELGIVNQAVPAADVLTAANQLAVKLSSKPPLVLQAIKQIVHNSATIDLEAALDLESQGLAMLASTEDFQEGTLAFLEKRKPQWKGR